jgi:hypothetical protein
MLYYLIFHPMNQQKDFPQRLDKFCLGGRKPQINNESCYLYVQFILLTALICTGANMFFTTTLIHHGNDSWFFIHEQVIGSIQTITSHLTNCIMCRSPKVCHIAPWKPIPSYLCPIWLSIPRTTTSTITYFHPFLQIIAAFHTVFIPSLVGLLSFFLPRWIQSMTPISSCPTAAPQG